MSDDDARARAAIERPHLRLEDLDGDPDDAPPLVIVDQRGGAVLLVRPPPATDPTIEQLVEYRRAHGCTLREAHRALGVRGTRIEVIEGRLGRPR